MPWGGGSTFDESLTFRSRCWLFFLIFHDCYDSKSYLQEKLEATTASLAEMEKRVVMAESMLEATLQYQSGQNKAQPSPM